MPVFAQQNNLFTSYTVNDGLPQSTINDIAQDKYGFIWIGTENGLCRFDGYKFTVYKHKEKDPNTINGDRSFHFYLDNSKRLWVVSFNGLSLYNAEKDSFVNLITYTPSDLITGKNHIFGEDDRYLWVGLNHYGIVRVDKKTLKTEIIPIAGCNNYTEHNSWYQGFLENGKLWIVAQRNFVIYDTGTGSSKTVDIPVLNILDVNATQVVGMNEKNTLLINKKDLSYKLVNITSAGIPPEINALYRSANNEVILCSNNDGLFYLDPVSGVITNNIATIGQGYSKRILSATCVYKDLSGNLWIGTLDDGLLKLTRPFRNFKLYRTNDDKFNGVFSIYADSDRIYAGCGNYGMDIFSRKTGFVKNVTLNSTQPSIVNRAFLGPSFNGDKLLLVADGKKNSINNIPLTYSKSSGKIEQLGADAAKFYAKYWGQGNYRYFIVKNADGSILTNIGQYLVSVKEDARGKISADTLKHFREDPISCFRDDAGKLWTGTFKGLYVFANNVWQAIKLPGIVEVKSINQDKDHSIWLGTPTGIYVLNSKFVLVTHWDETNGLINQHLYGILRDNEGNMWFSHNKGLSEYKWKEKTFKHFSTDDGLQSSEFNGGAYFKAADGELFFGGINGITAFYPNEINDNPNAPPVQITGIQVFDKPYRTIASYWAISTLTFPYTDNNVSFDLSLPEYTNQMRNTYAYTMEGVDHAWINSGDKRFARYTSLRPGTFVFKVKAANNNGVWGKATSIIIKIDPPFWQRIWFIILEIISAASAIAFSVWQIQKAVYRKKIRGFEMQYRIQSERERISRDLHDNIGTQLSLINKSIKEVTDPLNGITDAEKTRKLQSVQQGSVDVIDVLRETIWALNKPEITLEEFADNLKLFIQKKLLQYSDISVEFNEQDENEAVILSSAEALNLFRICQEAITNTIKYASASLINVTIHANNGKYEITVADNGTGFKQAVLVAGDRARYGLENMRFRSGEILCDLNIYATDGGGTSIIIAKK